MGECLIVRRGGESYELPVLSASYPKDVTVTAAAGASASFSISITTPGRPAEYTYQWYRNGAAVSGATAASLTLTGLTAAATYSVYCKVTNKAGSVNSRAATLTVRSYLPAYTYTGLHQLIDDGNFNWRLRLLTSGTLTFSHLGSAESRGAQAFLVGGGGGGGFHAGGGGGYTKTSMVNISINTPYTIIVGAGGPHDSDGGRGGTSSALGISAEGGHSGVPWDVGGNGGSGGGDLRGIGGSDGGNGGGWDGDTGGNGGMGQGTTTREFGEASGALYAGGGGGGKADSNPPGGAAGGAGGGGHGGWGGAPLLPAPGTPNTGGGGGGNYDQNAGPCGDGGSGIVIIRNHRG